jgi:hypothetical protein
VERFRHVQDFSHFSTEPWPLKISRTQARELLQVANVGEKRMQNLRAIFFNLIISNAMEKTEFDAFFVSLKMVYESASFPTSLKL